MARQSSSSRSTAANISSFLLFSAACCVVSIVAWKRRTWRKSSSSQNLLLLPAGKEETETIIKKNQTQNEKIDPAVQQQAAKDDDQVYLKLAHEYRLGLDPPQQSNFRVVAILVLENGETIIGTNDEPSPNISLSLCAERCAFLRYRAERHESKIHSIYIVTDADTIVAPGTQCREYMVGHPGIISPDKTRLVLQSNDVTTTPTSMFLSELIPYPSVYTGKTPQEQIQWGQNYQSIIREQLPHHQKSLLLAVPGLTTSTLESLLQAAMNATSIDTKDSLHPIRYGAAVAIETITEEDHGGYDACENIQILQASQIKALEYGSTLDAVSQLAYRILTTTTIHPSRVLAVVQVDQFGIPHTIFAQAKAFLVEHGFGDCHVILTTTTTTTGGGDQQQQSPRVVSVPARELAPLVPEFRS